MRRVPLLVKIAPDLADADIDAVADLALELGLDGIIATNTTIARTGLATPEPTVERSAPAACRARRSRRARSTVLRRLRARVGTKLVLIAVGGIETADDAWARIRAGATLVQAYTGFIYGGPLWPRRVQRELAAHVRAAGFKIDRAGDRRGCLRGRRFPSRWRRCRTIAAAEARAAASDTCRCSSSTQLLPFSVSEQMIKQYVGCRSTPSVRPHAPSPGPV